jgi:single-strand DNA-binding protein
MANVNKVLLTGNLTRDIELKYTKTGKEYAKFSIAVNGFKKEEVHFINIVSWDKTAELCSKYLKKGSPVLIEGRLAQNRYEINGEKRSTYEVVADRVHFLSKTSSSGSGSGGVKDSEFYYDDNDVPF